MNSPIVSQDVLIVTGALLFYVALTDLRHYKIRNDVILLLAALFFLHAAFSGRWTVLYWNIGFAALLFLIMLYFYARKLMGGGDVKLLTVAFLWVGPFCALAFALFLLVFVVIHVVAMKLNLVEGQIAEGQARLPFAPSIAAALIGVFMVGCLRPV
jgi:prepilin peptidase CpaA